MKSHILILTLTGLTLSLASCYTGDPSDGGLFGYSPKLNQQRQAEKVGVLHGIQADTRDRNAKARALSRQLDAQR